MSDFQVINNTVPIVATTAALARAFGIQKLQVPNAKDNTFEEDKLRQNFDTPDPSLYNSTLGTPVYADLTLKGGSYTDNITNQIVTFPELRFYTVLLTVSIVSKIVKTEIQGRSGTVKEYIGEDDAKISVQGIICGRNGVYPAEEVASLNEWRRAPVAKEAVSKYLQNLGINNLVVEDISLPQIAGGYSYQTFTMNCVSDLPVELKIT